MTYIFSVEGNIGSGKSTLLKELKNKLTQIQHYDIMYLQEPVNIWESFKDENGKSIIESFYENNKKFAFSFQMMAYISRLSQLKTTLKNNMNKNVIIITERSIHTDKEVFAKMLHDQKNMNKIEYDIYTRWHDWLCSEFKVKPSAFIYLKTDPIVSLERIKKRSRQGECGIPIEYLDKLDSLHTSWMDDEIANGVPVLILDVSTDFYNDEKEKEKIIKQLFEFLKTYGLVTNTKVYYPELFS